MLLWGNRRRDLVIFSVIRSTVSGKSTLAYLRTQFKEIDGKRIANLEAGVNEIVQKLNQIGEILSGIKGPIFPWVKVGLPS